MVERRFKTDVCELDASKISTYDHDVFGPVTVFKDVVIARAIVHKYDDGMAYKPGKELGAAYWTADGMWATSGGHPSTAVISTRDQIHGRTVNVRFTRGLIDPKSKRPMNRGILADLEVFNNKVPPETLSDMKNGKKTDVSIGFFFDYDDTAGVVEDEEDQSLKGVSYDYVQRNITINHVAFGIDNGRCPMPYCGIGADGVIREVAGDPVGHWKTVEECVEAIMRQNPSYTREQAEGTCGKIEKQSKEKDFKHTDGNSLYMKSTLEALKAALNEALNKLDALEAEKDDLVEEEYQGNASNETLSLRARMFFNISDDEWALLSEEEKNDYISRLPAEKPKEGETNKDEADAGPRTEAERARAHFNLSEEDWEALSDEEKQAYIDKLPERGSGGEDEDGCPECDDYDEFVMPYMAEDAGMSYAQKRALPDSAYAYIESGCEKEDGKTQQSCRHMPIHDESHVRAALAALGGARTGKVPPYAAKAKPKVCAAAKKFKIESEVCGTSKKKDVLSPDEVLEAYRRTVKDKDYPY